MIAPAEITSSLLIPPIFFGRYHFAIPSQSPWHRSTVMPHFLSFRFGRVIQCSPIKVSIKQFCGEKGTHCFSKGTQKPIDGGAKTVTYTFRTLPFISIVLSIEKLLEVLVGGMLCFP